MQYLKRLLPVLLALVMSLGMAVVADAHGNGKGNKGRKGFKQRGFERFAGDSDLFLFDQFANGSRFGRGRGRGRTGRLLGSRFTRRDQFGQLDSFGRQRSALAHHQNAERLALIRDHQEERRLSRLRGSDRRFLADHQRAELLRLREHQRRERLLLIRDRR